MSTMPARTVPSLRRGLHPGRKTRALIGGVLLISFLTACDGGRTEYSASTPDDALDSAQQMIVAGEADRLTDLVYADSPEMRSFLNQVGSLLGSLQNLGEAVEARFPEEFTKFREEAEQAAAEGRTNPVLARLLASSRRGSRGNGFGTSQINREGLTLDTGAGSPSPARRGNPLAPRQSESQRQIVHGIIKQLLADPYRWLEEGRDNLDTIYIADDRVALTWNDRPILPPFGLSMVEDQGRWFLVPPTAYPGVSMIMPRSEDEWFVWGSMVKTLERVAIDLEKDVRAGRVRNMTDLADTAAEKVAIPAMLVFFAYTNMVEQRAKEAPQAEAEAAAKPETEPQPELDATGSEQNSADQTPASAEPSDAPPP